MTARTSYSEPIRASVRNSLMYTATYSAKGEFNSLCATRVRGLLSSLQHMRLKEA